jgi:hypothetical protein
MSDTHKVQETCGWENQKCTSLDVTALSRYGSFELNTKLVHTHTQTHTDRHRHTHTHTHVAPGNRELP